eukprot:m.246329 g.246329  ORF g.246329 m.246329 type:complete len:329 (-) comp15852_c0_seq37:3438-4424(-)
MPCFGGSADFIGWPQQRHVGEPQGSAAMTQDQIAQNKVLEAVSRRIPKKQLRAWAQLHVGVGLASASCILDAILAHRVRIVRWRCLSRTLPGMAFPWPLNHSTTGEWESLCLFFLSDCVFHVCRHVLGRCTEVAPESSGVTRDESRSRRITNLPSNNLVLDLLSAAATYPLQVASICAAISPLETHQSSFFQTKAVLDCVRSTDGTQLLLFTTWTALRHSAVIGVLYALTTAQPELHREDRTVEDICGTSLRNPVVASLAVTAALIPLEVVLIRRHMGFMGVPTECGVCWKTIVILVGTFLLDTGLRFSNLSVTLQLASKLTTDMSPK